jgi:hypothetical protein
MPISQKNRPVGLTVIDSAAPVPWSHLFQPRPERVQYTHPGRGTIIQTFNGGFVDDFGEGLTDITVSGTTGWNSGGLPGESRFYALRDMVLINYHNMRKARAEAGMPIDTVKMYWADSLHMLAYEVYPVSFQSTKDRNRPLLYQYTIRLTGISRLFGVSNVVSGAAGAISNAIGGIF